MDAIASALVEAAGLQLHVTDVGQGFPVLLLHPFPLDASCFAPQVAALSAEHRVLTVDYPGFGHSPASPGPVPFDLFAKALRELLRARAVSSLDVVGVSMGCYAALELSHLAPLLLRRLVLAGGRASEATAAAKAVREGQAARAEREGVAFLVEDMGPKLLRRQPHATDLRRTEQAIARASPAGVAAAG